MAKKEPLLLGIVLCLASVIGLGLLLTMPAYDGWQKAQAQQQQLTADLASLTTESQLVDQDMLKLSQAPNLPKDIQIRVSNALDTKKNLKIMLDELIRSATTSGNQLISLLPGETSKTTPTPVKTPADAKTADGKTANPAKGTIDAAKSAVAASNAVSAGTSAADTTNQTGSEVAATPVVPTLQTYPYELSFRGNFDQVLNFLSQLTHHRELVEIAQVELKNEGGPQRQEYTGSSPYNRAKPIALKMNVKLVLEPKP